MLSSLFNSHVSASPDTVAWIEPDGQHQTWKQLEYQVTIWRQRLKNLGIGPHDIVVTQLANGLTPVVASIAIQSLQASESPVDKRFGDAFARMACERLKARAFISETGPVLLNTAGSIDYRTAIQNRWPPIQESALILWTSGTTAEPKAVVHDWNAIITNARGKLAAAPQTSNDRRLTVLPFSHAYARTCDMVTWLLSGCVLASGDGWRAIEKLGPIIKPTLINAVPYLIDKVFGSVNENESDTRIRLQQLGLDELRMLGCGGAALISERFKQIQRLGITPIQGYGLTETGPVICSASPADARPGVVGRVIEKTDIRISESGEIQCRGPGLMLGYWNDLEATSRRFTDDGWFRTGDSGVIESDGMLRISGRLDEVIVFSNGYKFWPLELERRLSMVQGVRHAIVRRYGVDLEVIVDALDTIDDADLLKNLQDAQRDNQLDCYEPKIVRIRRLPQSLSVEAGELTAKQTVRRDVVLRKYSET